MTICPSAVDTGQSNSGSNYLHTHDTHLPCPSSLLSHIGPALELFLHFFYPLIYPPSNLLASTRILKGLIVLTFLHLRIDDISTIPSYQLLNGMIKF